VTTNATIDAFEAAVDSTLDLIDLDAMLRLLTQAIERLRAELREAAR
jgi:hypothetical protein